MKKVLYTILALAVAAVACTKITDNSNVKLDSTEAPEVTIKKAGDKGDSLVATVAPAAKTGFYAYAITTSEAYVNAEDLLKGKYIGKTGYSSEVIEKEKDGEVITINLNGLQAGAEYKIYAVAASKMGVMTELSSASCTLDDPYAPSVQGYEYDVKDSVMVIAIKFNRELVLQPEAYVVAGFWGFYDENHDSNYKVLAPQKEMKVTKLAIDGNNLLVIIDKEEYISGAYVSITWPAGIVKSTVGQANNAYTTASFYYNEGPYKGIFAQYENAEFDIKLAMNEGGTLVEAPEDTVFFFTNPSTCPIYLLSDSAIQYDDEIEISYLEQSGRKVSYNTEAYNIGGKVALYLQSEAPSFGSYLSINIAEETYWDIWGNSNKAVSFENRFFRSYGYTIDQFIGTYNTTATSYFSGAVPDAGDWEIAKSDNAKKGNVMFKKMFGYTCTEKVYGEIDFDLGTLYIEEQNFLTGAIFAINAADFTYLKLPVAGKITIGDDYFGIVSGGSWHDVYTDFTATLSK